MAKYATMQPAVAAAHQFEPSLTMSDDVRIAPSIVVPIAQCSSSGHSNVPSAAAKFAYAISSANVRSVNSSSVAMAYPANTPVATATVMGSAAHFATLRTLPAFSVNAGRIVFHFNAAYAADPASSKAAMLL